MREILFRAKRMDNGGWVYGYYSPANMPLMGCVGHFINEGGYKAVEIDPETVCQFTGLTDENNVKIFEHDIVQDGIECAEILWDEEDAKFIMDGGDVYDIYGDFGVIDAKQVMVAGNTFDNSELMKEGAK